MRHNFCTLNQESNHVTISATHMDNLCVFGITIIPMHLLPRQKVLQMCCQVHCDTKR